MERLREAEGCSRQSGSSSPSPGRLCAASHGPPGGLHALPGVAAGVGVQQHRAGIEWSFLWIYGACSPFDGIVGDHWSRTALVAGSLGSWSEITVLSGFAVNGMMLLFLGGIARDTSGAGQLMAYTSLIYLATSGLAFYGIRRHFSRDHRIALGQSNQEL